MQLASAFGDSVEGKLNFYLNRVANIIAEDVGRCTPLSNVYNNTLIATCDKIFNPWVSHIFILNYVVNYCNCLLLL